MLQNGMKVSSPYSPKSYEIGDMVGQGACSQVYETVDTRLKRKARMSNMQHC